MSAARPELAAVLFDAGGTLVRLNFEWMAGAVADFGVAVDAAALRRAEIAGRRVYDHTRGHAPARGEPPPPLGVAGDTVAYFRATLEAAGVPAAQIGTALERFFARHARAGLWDRPMEGARGALDAIGALGLRRAVVSNSDGRAERHLSDAGVRDGLEFVVDSHRVGAEKPDPRIFAVALERMRLPAERVLYVGDILCVDAAGARAAGLHFVLIDPYGDYAPPGVAAIPGIADLPAWIARTFTIVSSRGAAVATEPDPSRSGGSS